MRNAKNSALNHYAPKNGCNRDGNEKVRKGLGCTKRSIRMGRIGLAGGMARGNYGPQRSPLANKIARQEPIFPLHEDGQNEGVCTWEWYGFFDRRSEAMDPSYMVLPDGRCIAMAEYEQSYSSFIFDEHGISFSC